MFQLSVTNGRSSTVTVYLVVRVPSQSSAVGKYGCHFTGVRMGAPLAFSSTTTNLAGSVLLALRPTM